MISLHLLIRKTGFHYLLKNANKIIKEHEFTIHEDDKTTSLELLLQKILDEERFDQIEVFSAFSIFGLTPNSILQHEYAKEIIALNSNLNENDNEVMLSINLKHKVQFYFAFAKSLYSLIKKKDYPTRFNFTGETFLQNLSFIKNKKSQVHINLYDNQVEFWVFKKSEILLYNHLDESSEVDFLYFILFSISKLPIDLATTQLRIYGDCDRNETFISELKKYAPDSQIQTKNRSLKNHIILHHV